VALVVGLLSAIHVTSRNALRQYVEDQLSRVPWDMTVYQLTELDYATRVREAIRSLEDVRQVENLYFLRASLPPTSVPEVDHKALRTPWLALLTATDPSLLPREVRPQSGKGVLVLVGSKAEIGDAYLALQGRRTFGLRVTEEDELGRPVRSAILFSVPLERTIRMERRDLNRWFMDQTSSPALIPEVGVILVVPRHDDRILYLFDAVARGLRIRHAEFDIHARRAEYLPDILHLVRINRAKLITGWDVPGSSARVEALGEAVRSAAQEAGYRAGLDPTTGALLQRMTRISRLVGLLTLLISLPLLWIAWILLANVSNLLVLNERRKLGLLRLRGAPGQTLAWVLLGSIVGGGIVGGLVGALVGTLLPLRLYQAGWLPRTLVGRVQPTEWIMAFIGIGVGMALVASLRLARYATSVSPLEASARVAPSEWIQGTVRFSGPQLVALLVGAGKVAGWVLGLRLAHPDVRPLAFLDQALDFVAFPLFVYGLATLVASRRQAVTSLMEPWVRVVAGPMAPVALRHLATRPHRVAAFLLLFAMLTTVSLYPTVMTAVFDHKLYRAAQVQLGGELQLILNGPDVLPRWMRTGRIPLRRQVTTVHNALQPVLDRIERLPGVAGVGYVVEALGKGLYMRGYGFDSIPAYLLDDVSGYLKHHYYEEALGFGSGFSEVLRRVGVGQVATAPALAAYWGRRPGDPMPIGARLDGSMATAPLAGSLHLLPGMPLATISDRESYVSARVEYLNYLFQNRAFVVLNDRDAAAADLDVLIPRVVLNVRVQADADLESVRKSVLAALPVEPLEVRGLQEELGRLGSDMFIFLARENMRVFLSGGLLLTVAGVVAVALCNYADDRRTLALLRVRGSGPGHVVQFLSPLVWGPSVVGLVVGVLVALLVGYGITDVIWRLREVLTILVILPTRLRISAWTVAVAMGLFALVVVLQVLFGRWVFRRTARESLVES
jgi:hypothetical protein